MEQFTCLNVRLGASSQANNFASAEYILDVEYGGEKPTTVIAD